MEISRKKDRFSGTFKSSVDFSLFPTRFATKPDTIDKIPVGCPIKNESSPVASQTYFRMIQGINDQ